LLSLTQFFVNITTYVYKNITLLFSLHFKFYYFYYYFITFNLITYGVLHLKLHLFLTHDIYYKFVIRDLTLYKAALIVYNTF